MFAFSISKGQLGTPGGGGGWKLEKGQAGLRRDIERTGTGAPRGRRPCLP